LTVPVHDEFGSLVIHIRLIVLDKGTGSDTQCYGTTLVRRLRLPNFNCWFRILHPGGSGSLFFSSSSPHSHPYSAAAAPAPVPLSFLTALAMNFLKLPVLLRPSFTGRHRVLVCLRAATPDRFRRRPCERRHHPSVRRCLPPVLLRHPSVRRFRSFYSRHCMVVLIVLLVVVFLFLVIIVLINVVVVDIP